jgi:hypothetical protein
VGLFSKKSTRDETPRLTISGVVQREPEGIGVTSRRVRLFGEVARRVQGHLLASPGAAGSPVADGLGLEELVRIILPIFEKDKSLIRWTAIRSALALLYYQTVAERNATPFFPVVEVAMGVGHIGDVAAGDDTIGVSPQWAEKLTTEQISNATGIYSVVFSRVMKYGDLADLDFAGFVAHPACQISNPVGLDMMAWIAIALIRINAAETLLSLPAPDRIVDSGWYTEPLVAKAERFWDGVDWTAQCRTQSGSFLSIPL